MTACVCGAGFLHQLDVLMLCVRIVHAMCIRLMQSERRVGLDRVNEIAMIAGYTCGREINFLLIPLGDGGD